MKIITLDNLAKFKAKMVDYVEQTMQGYATQSWVREQNYLTSHQSLDNYYTKSQADSKFLTSHQSLSNYATKDYVSTATNDMATKTWVNNQGFLTSSCAFPSYTMDKTGNNTIRLLKDGSVISTVTFKQVAYTETFYEYSFDDGNTYEIIQNNSLVLLKKPYTFTNFNIYDHEHPKQIICTRYTKQKIIYDDGTSEIVTASTEGRTITANAFFGHYNDSPSCIRGLDIKNYNYTKNTGYKYYNYSYESPRSDYFLHGIDEYGTEINIGIGYYLDNYYPFRIYFNYGA